MSRVHRRRPASRRARQPLGAGWRLGVVVLGVMVAFGACFYRLYYLHVLDRENLLAELQQSREAFEIQHARRGPIVDTRGNLLADVRPLITVGLDPQVYDAGRDADKLPALARLLGLSVAEIEAAAADRYTKKGEPRQWVKLHDGVGEGRYEEIRALGLRAVYGVRRFERYYPNGALAAHVLGFINKEGVPGGGIEEDLDFFLRGEDGWREGERDGRRRELVQFRRREVDPTHGYGVQLTIDSSVQHFAEEELRAIMEKFAPQSASIIVSEVTTGRILAMASSPAFDPNTFWEPARREDYPMDFLLRNRAVSDVFEPGSTFKIITVAAALEEGVVTPQMRFDCNRETIEYKGRTVRLPRDHDDDLGVLDVGGVLRESSNRGAAQIGFLLGEERLYNYARAFGFAEQSGLGFPREAAGLLLPVPRWDGLTLSRLPIGYAVAANALQVHFAAAAVANGGVLMEPRLVERVFDETGESVVRFEPRPRRRVISEENARILTGMLREVCTDGTAKAARIPGFDVAGKTGTARKIVEGEYRESRHVASFTGFFPAARPRYAITVVVDGATNRNHGYGGGAVAAPSFSSVGKQLVRYFALEPVEPSSPTLARWEGGMP